MVVRKYRLPVASVALLALLLQVLYGTAVALLPWLITALLLWLFRDPPLRARSHPMALVSPVRGTVRAAGPGEDPYEADRSGHLVQIDADWRGPYLVRCPIEGSVVEQWSEWRDPVTGSRHRGRALRIRTDEGDEVLLALAGRLTVDLGRYLGIGDRVGHAKAIGLMPFGGRAALHFTGHGRILATPGQRVLAGVDPVAELIHD